MCSISTNPEKDLYVIFRNNKRAWKIILTFAANFKLLSMILLTNVNLLIIIPNKSIDIIPDIRVRFPWWFENSVILVWFEKSGASIQIFESGNRCTITDQWRYSRLSYRHTQKECGSRRYKRLYFVITELYAISWCNEKCYNEIRLKRCLLSEASSAVWSDIRPTICSGYGNRMLACGRVIFAHQMASRIKGSRRTVGGGRSDECHHHISRWEISADGPSL